MVEMDFVGVSGRGQVVIPARMRKALGLKDGDRLLARLEGDRIVLSRAPSNADELYREVYGDKDLPTIVAEAEANRKAVPVVQVYPFEP